MSLTLQTPITSQKLLQVQLFPCRNDCIPVTDNRSKKALICCDTLGGGFPGHRSSSKSSYLTHGVIFLLNTGPGKDQHFPPVARGLKVPATCRYRGYGCDKWVLCHPQCSAILRSCRWYHGDRGTYNLETPFMQGAGTDTGWSRGQKQLWSPFPLLCKDKNFPLNSPAGSAGRNGATSALGTSSACIRTASSRETNLKFRQALLVTHQELVSEESMATFDGRVTCEEPNSRMHSFTGTLEWRGETYSLNSERILLRGCKLRNTDICYGLVIYAGFDSKIMRNCGKIKRKKTKLDRMMDRLVIIIFLVLLVTSLCLAIASGFWARMFQEKHSYLSALYKHTTPAQQAFFNFWGFTILLSIIIPMSMYITFEFIYLVNSFFINWDLEMYYAVKDIPAKARSTSLNDQLGQIEYIFSDKTGTLTQNIMSFKKCCINGTIYGTDTGRENKQPSGSGLTWNHHREKKMDCCDATLLEAARRDSDPVLREFLRLLAICHTVMVEDKGGQLVYQAASPDEEALVLAARNLGYIFLARTQDTITISELGKKRTYKVLAMLDFNSDRKRMSVLVRDPQGTIRLYTKGADTVILERLQRRGPNETFTEMALDRFAEETLRTLCLASKEVSEVEYSEWSRRHREASVLLQDRAQELDKLYEEMEQNLQLLGATAIEDKLQDGVPETIQLLKLGNIKVWVLTGDKQETAMNIGYACKLLTDDMEILEEKEISEILEACWVSNNHLSGSGEALCSGRLSQQHSEASRHKKRAIIISGDFLDKILHTGEVLKEKKGRLWWQLPCCRATDSQEQGSLVEKAFVDLATSCQAVICCRVTPKQKALIVQLVKKHKKAITLAIGDGANDVNMIKTADIGVGISGLEGMQAVQCSDYALAQFSYLQRLLFIHGRWAYLRICKFLRYFFYKTFAGLMAQVWFAFHSGFTAQPLYEGWFLALYNIFYTTYPVLSMGLLEQDVSAKKSLEFPELYVIGQQDELFNYRVFGITLLHGVSTSLASFYIALWAFEDHVGSKVVGDYESFAVTVATSALLSVLMEIILDTKFWTALSFLMVTASLLLFCLFSFLTQSINAFRIAPAIFRFPGAISSLDPSTPLWGWACHPTVVPSVLSTFPTSPLTSCVDRRQPERPDRPLHPARCPAVPGGEHHPLAHRPLVLHHHRQKHHPAKDPPEGQAGAGALGGAACPCPSQVLPPPLQLRLLPPGGLCRPHHPRGQPARRGHPQHCPGSPAPRDSPSFVLPPQPLGIAVLAGINLPPCWDRGGAVKAQNWLVPSFYGHFINLIWMVLKRGQPPWLQRGWPSLGGCCSGH
ncbi:phospholipid-transporting ATPase IK isoform 3-T3 [Theristicus caerulescens]